MYDALVALHVLCALVGFGAVGLSGLYGAAARAPDRPGRWERAEETRRYFQSRGLAEWLILPVPFLGAAALAVGHKSPEFADAWVIGGAAVWAGAATLLLLVVRPAERRLRAAARGGSNAAPQQVGAARRLAWSAGVSDALFVVALALMVSQPA